MELDSFRENGGIAENLPSRRLQSSDTTNPNWFGRRFRFAEDLENIVSGTCPYQFEDQFREERGFDLTILGSGTPILNHYNLKWLYIIESSVPNDGNFHKSLELASVRKNLSKIASLGLKGKQDESCNDVDWLIEDGGIYFRSQSTCHRHSFVSLRFYTQKTQ